MRGRARAHPIPSPGLYGLAGCRSSFLGVGPMTHSVGVSRWCESWLAGLSAQKGLLGPFCLNHPTFTGTLRIEIKRVKQFCRGKGLLK